MKQQPRGRPGLAGGRQGKPLCLGDRDGRKTGRPSQLKLVRWLEVSQRTGGSPVRKCLPGRGNSIWKGSVAWSSRVD